MHFQLLLLSLSLSFSSQKPLASLHSTGRFAQYKRYPSPSSDTTLCLSRNRAAKPSLPRKRVVHQDSRWPLSEGSRPPDLGHFSGVSGLPHEEVAQRYYKCVWRVSGGTAFAIPVLWGGTTGVCVTWPLCRQFAPQILRALGEESLLIPQWKKFLVVWRMT